MTELQHNVPPRSELLVMRQPLAVRHSRVFGALVFAALAALSLAPFSFFLVGWGVFYFAAAAAAASAVLPGARYGAKVLSDTTITEAEAGNAGMTVVANSHLLLGVVAGTLSIYFGCASGLCDIFDIVRNFFGCLVVFPIASVVCGGLITFPLGYFGARLLWRYRQRATAPVGCKLHGYREVSSD